MTYGLSWWTAGRFLDTTEDAYVVGNFTAILPDISGLIAEIAGADNQPVGRGQLLVRILEATHQLLFLGIDADDGPVRADKALSLTGDVLELPVPMRTAGAGEILAVAAQCNTQLFQQAPYGVWADGQRPRLERSGAVAGAYAADDAPWGRRPESR